MKRKYEEVEGSAPIPCSRHGLNEPLLSIRSQLLSWYDAHKRTLPWRSIASCTNAPPEQKGYSVWISEVMLQQTQVATVIDYYNRWIQAWPSVSALASADLDSINRLWSGLGYYSRAQRLLQGAQKILEEYGPSSFPSSKEELLRIPGVGRYTASAIASIAFGEPVGVLDGNVTRVLCRLRALGKDSSSKAMTELLWELADELVDKDRPGDFNQSIMELGARICVPKSPSCSLCPLKGECSAFKGIKRTEDIEDCHLCIKEYDHSKGVMNYPVKKKKTKAREESTNVLIIRTMNNQYILFQRPTKGLLANLFEFYSVEREEELKVESLREALGLTDFLSISYFGDVFHQFSHISQTYKVWSCKVKEKKPEPLLGEYYQSFSLLKSEEEVLSSSLSTAMKKVFKFYQAKNKDPTKKQSSIKAFLKSK